MTDLRESVARAIWDKDFRPMPAWDEMTWPEKLGYQKMATAALRAVADAGPTEKMVSAAAEAMAARRINMRAADFINDARAALAAAFKTMGR